MRIFNKTQTDCQIEFTDLDILKLKKGFSDLIVSSNLTDRFTIDYIQICKNIYDNPQWMTESPKFYPIRLIVIYSMLIGELSKIDNR